MNQSRHIGSLGEKIAEAYLIEKGFTILFRNFSSRYGEIDIIGREPMGMPGYNAQEGTQNSPKAKDKANGRIQTIVFFEVKSYKPGSMVHPLEAITPSKKKKILKTAKLFAYKNKLFNHHLRFDALVVRKNTVETHLENIIQDAD
ncbi:YraN family protein [Thermoproteota archaeon]